MFFIFFTQNIDCGGSNEYPQSMFRSKNKKNRYTPAYPSFATPTVRLLEVALFPNIPPPHYL